MSSRHAVIVAALTVALSGVAPGLRGQERDVQAELMQHIDTLVPLVEQANAERQRAGAVRDSLARATPSERMDTLRIGPLRVVTFPDQVPAARDIVGAVWEEWDDLVTRSDAFEPFTFFFNWSLRNRPAWLGDPLVKEISAPVFMPRSFIEENARVAIWAVLNQGVLAKTEVGRWAAIVRPPHKPERGYRELMTTPSKANRACVAGDAGACLSALGLRIPGDQLEAWYTPQERVRLALHPVAQYGGWTLFERRFSKDAALLRRCESDGPKGDVGACDEWLRAGLSRVPGPLQEGRSTFAWLALEEGGAGAFDRMTADSTMSPEQALVAASGLSLDALAKRWLDWVEASRPVVYSDLGTIRWTTLFWFLFFGLLALRSTRWRSE